MHAFLLTHLHVFLACGLCIWKLNFSPILLISSLFPSSSYMRDQLAHAFWILSHIARSAFEDHRDRNLGQALAAEVKVLQAELHHTQRLLAGYSEVVSTCEKRNSSQSRINDSLIVLLVLLLGLLLWFWIQKRFVRQPVRTTVVADTGGSSESESGTDVPKFSVPQLRSGPVRPSQLLKNRQ